MGRSCAASIIFGPIFPLLLSHAVVEDLLELGVVLNLHCVLRRLVRLLVSWLPVLAGGHSILSLIARQLIFLLIARLGNVLLFFNPVVPEVV